MKDMEKKLSQVIWGTLIGDSIGLPMEGLKPHKIEQLGWTSPLKHRFLFGRGMWSDDTDHTLHLIDAALKADGDPILFKRLFSRRLKFWLSTLPPGIGLGTLRSIVKQVIGVPLSKTGVFSAGNGPSMRAASIGVIYPNNDELRRSFTVAHTELTHSDPKALDASALVSDVAAAFVRGEHSCQNVLAQHLSQADGEWQSILEAIQKSLNPNLAPHEALKTLGIIPRKGVSGYSYHTVPAVLYVGMKHQWDFEPVITEIISLGGDTDSTAAIAGALAALHPSNKNAIPATWSQRLTEWPITTARIDRVCKKIGNGERGSFYKWYLWPFLLLRNLVQFLVIFVHLVFRLLTSVLYK